MHHFRYVRDRLQCEDVPVEVLAEKYGTPLFVYSSRTFREHYQRLDRALKSLDHMVCYAVKANSNLAVLNILAKEGAGFDIVSAGELFRVIKAGGDPSRCTFAGVCKTREEMEFALKQGIYCFNIESEPEVHALNEVARRQKRIAPIAIRINPNVDARTHKYISTGKSENKFGVDIERALALYAEAARMPHIRIIGVQMHIGSQITEPAPFARAVKRALPLVRTLKQRYNIEFFSVGGGIGIVYDPSLESGSAAWWNRHAEAPMTVGDYAAAIVPQLKPLGLRILVEPGRMLAGNAGILVTRVHYLKQTAAKRFVIVDAGMNDFIRPALYEGHHQIVPVRRSRRAPLVIADVVGPVCESGDFFAQNRPIPNVGPEDLLALMSAGAYGFVMSSNYNSRPLAAEVMVDGERHSLVRKRQTQADLIRGESIVV
jgi:diaminopimelate decarboxylase